MTANRKNNKKMILDLFTELEQNNIEYVLLRNLDGSIPEYYTGNKDIDLLVSPKSREAFRCFMHKKKWRQINHPCKRKNDFTFLYAMNPFEFYINKSMKLDVCYQLSCRSTNAGEWMPLDRAINSGLWKQLRRNQPFGWFELAEEYEFVHLLTRCIFDKKEFKVEYISRIDMLLLEGWGEKSKLKLDKIFFKFTEDLLNLLQQRRYGEIIDAYLHFTNY